MSNQMAAAELSELETEIRRRCTRCASGKSPEVRRDLTGAIRWFHSSDGGDAVGCDAAILQPWRGIARRAQSHGDETVLSRLITEELGRGTA
jgi:hypothetical protein